MNQAPPLSVLIVTYNSEEHIAACLESLLPQLASLAGEIILVDNASTDSTIEIVEQQFREEIASTLVRNDKNLGFAPANNQALALAKGRDILLLNPDTVIDSGILTGLLDILHQDDSLGAVAPQLCFPDGRVQRSCRRFPSHWNILTQLIGLAALAPGSRILNGWKMGDFSHDEVMLVDQPAAAALLIRGELFRELEGFDSAFRMFFNDVDLCKRVHDAGYSIRFDPSVRVTHIGGGSVKRSPVRMVISSQLSFFRYFEKHYTGLHHQILNLIIGLLLYLALIPRIMITLFRKPLGDTL